MIPTHCTAEELFKLTETELGIFSTQEGADNSMVTRSTISNFSFFESLERDLSNGVIKIHKLFVFANLAIPGPRPKN